MDYEKKYKEALEKLRDFYRDYDTVSYLIDVKDELANLFPELKESDDERMIKFIKQQLFNIKKTITDNYKLDTELTKAIDWLEKQDNIDLEFFENGENEKREFVGYGFLKCKGDFLSFKEGETYWLEYMGKDNYNVRSDNLLGQTFHITPQQLYTVFRPTTWLEKQGEQPKEATYTHEVETGNGNIKALVTEKVQLPKFKVGDWCIDNEDGVIFQIVKVLDNTYTYKTNEGKKYSCSHYSLENDAKLWTIQDAKDGDVLACGDKITDCPFIFHNLTDELNPRSYCGINRLQHFQDNDENGGFWCCSDEVRPATKEQRDTLMKAMTDAGWEWNAEKKELKKISQRMISAEAKKAMYDKPTDEEMKELLRTEYEKGRADAIAEMQKGWSEEDECILFRIINDLKFLKDTISIDPNYAVNITDIEREIDWLKSLKDRCTWKPSDEQMDALLSEVTAWTKGCPKQKVLESLYNDLKKLMEK